MAATRKSRRKACPYCGSRDTRPIVYGLVTGPSDDFVPGGCLVTIGQPERSCRTCCRHFEYPGNVAAGPRVDDPEWAIDLVRIVEGEDPYLTRDVRWGGLVSIEDARTEPRTEDAWILSVVGILQEVCPGLTLGDDPHVPGVLRHDGRILRVRAWQAAGPIVADISPDSVVLRARVDRAPSDRSETFALLWRSCAALTDRAGCLAFSLYDDLPVDIMLELESARARYGDWV